MATRRRKNRIYSLPALKKKRKRMQGVPGIGGVRKNQALFAKWKESELLNPNKTPEVLSEEELRQKAHNLACEGFGKVAQSGDHQCPDCGRWFTIPGHDGGTFPWHLPASRVTPKVVSDARKRVLYTRLLSCAATDERPKVIQYLWWPEDNAHKYELRDGNPPADQDRPPWLRGLTLHIDVTNVPEKVWQAARYEMFVAANKAHRAPVSPGLITPASAPLDKLH